MLRYRVSLVCWQSMNSNQIIIKKSIKILNYQMLKCSLGIFDNFEETHPMKVFNNLKPPIKIPVNAAPSISEIIIYFPDVFFSDCISLSPSYF